MYTIEAKPYHVFLGVDCEPTFKIVITKESWSWTRLCPVREVVFSYENRDWYKAVKAANRFISQNIPEGKVIYPDWYRFIKNA